MGASFRNTGQILELAGCDLLTISPNLLEELAAPSADTIPRKLSPSKLTHPNIERLAVTEENFRWLLSDELMATVK